MDRRSFLFGATSLAGAAFVPAEAEAGSFKAAVTSCAYPVERAMKQRKRMSFLSMFTGIMLYQN